MYEFLKRFKGLKRVDNYIRQQQANKAAEAARGPLSREEQESVQIAAEKRKQDLESYKVVDKIIACKDTETDGIKGTEYLCRWQGLGYQSCTWESKSPLPLISWLPR